MMPLVLCLLVSSSLNGDPGQARRMQLMHINSPISPPHSRDLPTHSHMHNEKMISTITRERYLDIAIIGRGLALPRDTGTSVSPLLRKPQLSMKRRKRYTCRNWRWSKRKPSECQMPPNTSFTHVISANTMEDTGSAVEGHCLGLKRLEAANGTTVIYHSASSIIA